MNVFYRGLRSESIRLRRSWNLFLVKALPLPPAILTLLLAVTAERGEIDGMHGWWNFAVIIWAGFCLPMGISLVTFLGWHQDVEAQGLKHVLAQPSPRGLFHAVKATVAFVQITAAHALLGLALLAGAALAAKLNSDLGRDGVPWRYAFGTLGLLAAASMPLVALHTWVGVRLRGPGWALLTGLLGLYGTRYFQDTAAFLYWVSPWAPLSSLLDLFGHHIALPKAPFIGVTCVGSALLLVLGILDFHYREAPRES